MPLPRTPNFNVGWTHVGNYGKRLLFRTSATTQRNHFPTLKFEGRGLSNAPPEYVKRLLFRKHRYPQIAKKHRLIVCVCQRGRPIPTMNTYF